MADIVDVINLTTALDFSVTDLSIAETLPAGSTRQFTLHNTADDVQGSDQLESLWNNGQVDIQLNGVSITGYPFLSSWGNNIFDASTLVKGITKLSVAPVLATNPIAVGDNDPRLASAADVNPTPDTEMLRDGIGGGNVRWLNVFDPDIDALLISDYNVNIHQVTDKKGLVIYDDGDGVDHGSIKLGTSNQGDPVPGWGYLTAEISGVTAPLQIKADPIKLSGGIEHAGFMQDFPHILEADASPYSILSSDYIVVVAQTAPGAFNILLPSVAVGRTLIIKDGLGDAFVNNITLTANGIQLIDGAATYVINTNRGAVCIIGVNINSVSSWTILWKKVI